MQSFEHKKLIASLAKLDEVPADPKQVAVWIEAEAHLNFLRENAFADELVIYASGEYSFVHAVAVPDDCLATADQRDLLNWSFNPFTSIASYVTGGGRDDVWVERGLSGAGTQALKNAIQLVFGRTFEGWTGSGRTYYDLHQEYAHLAGIHWRPESRAYCRYMRMAIWSRWYPLPIGMTRAVALPLSPSSGSRWRSTLQRPSLRS